MQITVWLHIICYGIKLQRNRLLNKAESTMNSWVGFKCCCVKATRQLHAKNSNIKQKDYDISVLNPHLLICNWTWKTKSVIKAKFQNLHIFQMNHALLSEIHATGPKSIHSMKTSQNMSFKLLSKQSSSRTQMYLCRNVCNSRQSNMQTPQEELIKH